MEQRMRARFVNEYLELPPKSKEDIIRDLSALSKDELSEQLIKASEQGLTSIVKWIVEAGADVNKKNINGLTPIMLASIHGHTDVIRILVNNGVNINVTYTTGWTPLMIAVYNDRIDSVKFLLDSGADFNIKDNHGKTALMYATKYKYKEIISLLKKYGAKE